MSASIYNLLEWSTIHFETCINTVMKKIEESPSQKHRAINQIADFQVSLDLEMIKNTSSTYRGLENVVKQAN